MLAGSTLFAFVMAVFVAMLRMKEARKPASRKRIIMPPLFMTSGFSMFLYPPFRVDLRYAAIAFLAGVALSYPLIVTSKFEVVGNQVYLKRSKWFLAILLGLIVLRIALREYVNQYVGLLPSSGLFFILAYGMIITWRMSMLWQFERLMAQKNG